MNERAIKALRHYLTLLLILFVAHLAVHLFYIVALASAMEHSLTQPDHSAMILLIAFSLAMFVILILCLNIPFARNGEQKRAYQALLKAQKTSFAQKLKFLYRDVLFSTLLLLAFQIPFAVFYAMLGFSYDNMVFFERFYVLDVAFYELTGSAILGWLLNGILFFLCSMLLRLGALHLWKKEYLA